MCIACKMEVPCCFGFTSPLVELMFGPMSSGGEVVVGSSVSKKRLRCNLGMIIETQQP